MKEVVAQFNFYVSFDESLDLVQKVSRALGCEIIPDLGVFKTPEASHYKEITKELIEQLDKRRVLYLKGSFSKEAPVFTMRDGGTAKGTFYMEIVSGGPFIHMTLSRVNEVDGMQTIVGGMVSIQKHYVDYWTRAIVNPSQELKDAYNLVVKVMKKDLVQFQLGNKIYIAPKVLELLKKGEVRIIDKGVV